MPTSMVIPSKTIGRAFARPRAQHGGESPAMAQITKPASRYRDAAGKSLIEAPTPDELKSALTRAARGLPSEYFKALAFFLQNDSEIPGAMRSLISAVTEDGVVFARADEADEAERQEAFLRAVFEELDLVALIESLLRGHYYGFSAPIWLSEWGPYTVGGQTYMAPVTYEELPHDWLYAKKETAESEVRTLYVGDAPYHSYPTGSVLLYTASKLPSRRHIDFTRFGCGLAASRFGMVEWYNIEDWSAFNEAVGTPAIIGTLLQGYSTTDYDLLKQAVFNLSSDSRAIITDRTTIAQKSDAFKASGAGLYEKLFDAAARAKARIIKSESLTDNMNRHGSNAAMITTNGIRLDVAAHLARRVTRLVNRRLVYPVLDMAFPRRLVSWRLAVEAVADLAAEVRIDKELHAMNVPLSLSDLYARYRRRKPESDEDTLAKKAAFSPFGGP